MLLGVRLSSNKLPKKFFHDAGRKNPVGTYGGLEAKSPENCDI